MRGKNVDVSTDLSAWTDAGAVSAEARESVIWAVERGIVPGFADGCLHPAQSVSCGETIEMIKTIQQKL